MKKTSGVAIAVIGAGISFKAGQLSQKPIIETKVEYAHNPSPKHYCRNLHENSKDPELKRQGEEESKKCRKQEGWE